MHPTIAGEALSYNSEHNYLLYGHYVKLIQMDPTIAGEALSQSSDHSYQLY